MKRLCLVVLLPLWAASVYLHGQNTGPRATPQTQNAAPAAVRDAGPARGVQRPAGQAPRVRASSGSHTTRQGGTQHRTPAPAANGSVSVIGGTPGKQGSMDGGAALPGVTLPHNTLGISAGTPIYVRLQQTIDSGHARNGDVIRAVLAQPLAKLPSGAPVTLTVVASAPAGEIGSSGVLSVQVISINGEQVLSQVITAEGKEGQKLLPDDAPAPGTNAVFSSDAPIAIPAA